MHYRLFVLTDKDNAKTSSEAREYVKTKLEDDGFCTQGRWSYGPADWFVIGGRWSGELTRMMLDKAKMKAFYDECEKEKLFWVSKDNENINKLRAQVLFNKYFPDYKGPEIIWRSNQYDSNGAEDDAMIVTQPLWDAFMAEGTEKRTSVVMDVDGGIIDTDSGLDGESVKGEDVIGKKWMVVVDYHN